MDWDAKDEEEKRERRERNGVEERERNMVLNSFSLGFRVQRERDTEVLENE